MPLELRAAFRPRHDVVWRDVHWPPDLAPEIAVSLLRQIATDDFIGLTALEVGVRDAVVRHRLGVPAPAAPRVEQLFTALVPSSALTQAMHRTAVAAGWRITITNRQRPLQVDHAERVARALLAALTAVKEDEEIVLQWLLGPSHPPRPVPTSEGSAAVEPSWRLVLTGATQLDPDRRRALETKRGDYGCACIGRVAIRARTPARTRALGVGVLAALRTAETAGVRVKLTEEDSDRLNNVVIPWRWPYVLNVKELVGLLGWPLGDQPLPGIPRDTSRWLRPDERIQPNRRVIGAATAPGEERQLGLSIDDARHHLHVIGPTGTGKSTLLTNLICQDIAAGRSVVAIEPKGDLIEDVLARIPPERVDDVVVIDPTDTDFPVGLNPLLRRGRRPELIADQVLAVFHGLWAANWGPRLQDILHSSLLTLAARADTSLCALPALLTNPSIRRRFRSGIDDPIALEPFWAWFDSISDAERQQAIAPVMNKLRPFLLRKSVRAIVGQLEPKFRVDELFTRRRIVLVSLARGRIGPEAAALLGSLFVAELWQAVLARTSVRPERRHPVIVYADEFQEYVHLPTDMADALAQARGLGVGLTLAHQHLAQLPAPLRAAVLANARSRVCFQLAGDDAQTIARFAGDRLQPIDFQRLRRYEAYTQLVVGGEVSEFASIRTLPLTPPTSNPQDVREASRRRYGRPAREVEDEIRKLVEGKPDDEAPVGRRRREP